MRTVTRILASLCILGLLFSTAATAAEKSRADVLDAACERLVKVMNPEDMKSLFAVLDRMKDVGLSWNEELLVPQENIVSCKTPEQLYVLWGMLAIDSTYTLLFEKNPERFFAEGIKLEEIIKFPRDVLKQESFVLNRDEKVDKSVAFIHAMLNTSKTDPVVLNTLVGGFYGSTLELFHIFSSLGLAAGVTDEFTKFVNDHLPQLVIARELLDAYSGDGELALLLDTENRKAVITSIIDIIQRDMATLTEDDLKQILSIVAAVRDPLVAHCE